MTDLTKQFTEALTDLHLAIQAINEASVTEVGMFITADTVDKLNTSFKSTCDLLNILNNAINEESKSNDSYT